MNTATYDCLWTFCEQECLSGTAAVNWIALFDPDGYEDMAGIIKGKATGQRKGVFCHDGFHSDSLPNSPFLQT